MPCTGSRLVPDLSRTASRLDAELERRFLWRGEACSYVVGANKSFRLCHLCPEMGAMAIFVVACISGHMSILKFDCFLIARAELRPRGRNTRRHPNFPRVKKYRFFAVLVICSISSRFKEGRRAKWYRLIFLHACTVVLGNSVSASAQGGIGKSGKHVVDPFPSSFTCMKFLSIVLEKKRSLNVG